MDDDRSDAADLADVLSQRRCFTGAVSIVVATLRSPGMRDTDAMGDDRSGGLVTQARELERRDIDVVERLDVVVDLVKRVDDVRASAGRVRAALTALPGELTNIAQAEREARAREAEAQRELAEAENRLADVGRSRRVGEDAKDRAERVVRRATVAASDAKAAVARTQERYEKLAGDEVTLRAEGERLAVEARDVATAVATVPRLSDSGRTTPGGSLEEIEEWGARVHAALFVVRGGLENERERIVLEANALATAALGEQVGGSSVSLVRRRLEQSLSDA